VKAIKSDSDSDSDEQKRSSENKIHRGDTAELATKKGKNIGVTPSVAAQCVTHHSDATVKYS